MKKSSLTLLIAVFLFWVSCHSTKTDAQKFFNARNYGSLAVEKYGNDFEYFFNSPKTYVICLKRNKPTPQIPQYQISFFIYDLKKNEIIFEESSIDAEVEWRNDHQVQVKITPGIISGDETTDDFTYVYDVTSRKKIK